MSASRVRTQIPVFKSLIFRIRIRPKIDRIPQPWYEGTRALSYLPVPCTGYGFGHWYRPGRGEQVFRLLGADQEPLRALRVHQDHEVKAHYFQFRFSLMIRVLVKTLRDCVSRYSKLLEGLEC